jgi:hypothetical protein
VRLASAPNPLDDDGHLSGGVCPGVMERRPGAEPTSCQLACREDGPPGVSVTITLTAQRNSRRAGQVIRVGPPGVRVERPGGTAQSYVRIAQQGVGISSHVNETVVVGSTYCHDV